MEVSNDLFQSFIVIVLPAFPLGFDGIKLVSITTFKYSKNTVLCLYGSIREVFKECFYISEVFEFDWCVSFFFLKVKCTGHQNTLAC